MLAKLQRNIRELAAPLVTFTGEVARPLIPQTCLSINLNSDPDVITDVEAGPSPPPKRICWSSSDELDVCKHCLSDQKIGHECNRHSLIQNSLELLERKGIDLIGNTLSLLLVYFAGVQPKTSLLSLSEFLEYTSS